MTLQQQFEEPILRLSEEETKLVVGSLGCIQATLDEMPASKEVLDCKNRLQTVWMLLGDFVPGPYHVTNESLFTTAPKHPNLAVIS